MRAIERMSSLLLFSILVIQGTAQDVYLDANTAERVVYTHGGTFEDSGREDADYSNYETNEMTLCSSNGETLRLNFKKFDLENGKDFLYAYDGLDKTSPRVKGSPFTGKKAKGMVIKSTGACLTFKMSSDFNVTRSGWSADINMSESPLVRTE